MAKSKSAIDADGKKVNKSQAIRDVLATNPKLKMQEVVAQLAAKGTKVTPQLVYFIMSKVRHKRRWQKREQLAETIKQAPARSPVDVIRQVKKLAEEMGGLKVLKQLVDLLAE